MVAIPDATPVRSNGSHAEALSRSQIYLDYQRAFTRGTGLPLALHAPAMIRLARYAKQQENPFCALMAKTRTACAACYALQLKLEQETKLESTTLRCSAGMCESVAPVRAGGRVIAFLHTGQVFLQPPTRRQFSRVAATLLKCGADVDLKSAEEAYFHTRVIPPARYKSLLKLVAIFAGHLANCADTLLLRAQEAEPPAVAKARLFIQAHQTEELSLARVAQAVQRQRQLFQQPFQGGDWNDLC